MTFFAGIRSTADFSTDERPKSFRETILFLENGGDAPLFALTQFFKDEATTDAEFAWWTEALDVPRLLTTGNYSATSTAIEVQASTVSGVRGSALALQVGDLLMVEKAVASGTIDNEIWEVSSIASQTSFVVKRGARGSSAAGITGGATNVFVTKIGNAFAEGESSPSPRERNPQKFYNYTQIFKHSYAITRTAHQSKFRTGDPLKNDERRTMFDHAAAIEMALFFGRRYEETSAGSTSKPRRTTGGLLDPNIGISTTAFATTPSEGDFVDAMEPIFQRNAPGAGNQRIGLCGNGFLNKFNKALAASSSTRFNYDGTIKVRGMELRKYITPQGEIAFKTHPLLSRNPLYTNSCFIIAPGLLRIRMLQDTELQENIQNNDEDQQKNQFLTELGLEIHHPSLMQHFHITGA